MKIKNMKWTMVVALATVSAGLTSCSDEPDKYEVAGGTPTISYIRPVDVAAKDSLLEAASLKDQICIVGNNLRSIKELYFNDQKAVLNTSYMTDHTILLTVPGNIPDKISDKIYMVTGGNDTIPYDFKVTIPAPSIGNMSNEWADPGEEVAINGSYFLDYDNYPLEIKVGDNYTLPRSAIKSIGRNQIVFTIPEDMPKDFIHVIDKFGDTKAPFKYKDDRGMIFDFDTPNAVTNEVLGNNGWHAQTITKDESSLSGNYLQLGDGDATMAADGGWNDGKFSFEYWCGNWRDNETYADHPRLCDVADFSDWNNKSIKFEMMIPESNPWMAGSMQVIFGSPAKISQGNAGAVDKYGMTLGGSNNTWFHAEDGMGRGVYTPWAATGKYDTKGKWVTVTIPLKDFDIDYDGNKANNLFKSVVDFSSLNIFIIRGAYNDKSVLPMGTDCQPIIKIDNIRVVPNI